VDDVVSCDEEVKDVNEGVSVYNKEATLPDDEVSSDDEDVLGDDEVNCDSKNTKTGKPDTSVLKLYHPLKLAQFSKEEQVYISLLLLLKEIKAPLIAFTRILNWAAKSIRTGINFN
jgi:hypothetical protein